MRDKSIAPTDAKQKRADHERQITEGFNLVRAALIALSRLSAEAGDNDRIPHPKWGCRNRRQACELATTGAIKATKIGRTWFARREDLDAFFAAHEVVKSEPSNDVLSAVDQAMSRKAVRK